MSVRVFFWKLALLMPTTGDKLFPYTSVTPSFIWTHTQTHTPICRDVCVCMYVCVDTWMRTWACSGCGSSACLLSVLKYRIPALQSGRLIWIMVPSVPSFETLGSLLDVSYFRFPHLKNGGDDDDEMRPRILMRMKPLNSPLSCPMPDP